MNTVKKIARAGERFLDAIGFFTLLDRALGWAMKDFMEGYEPFG